METTYNDNNTVTLYVDGAFLQRMEALDLAVWYTSGGGAYVADQVDWAYDRCIATTSDILDAFGYDFSEGLTVEDVAELTVSLN